MDVDGKHGKLRRRLRWRHRFQKLLPDSLCQDIELDQANLLVRSSRLEVDHGDGTVSGRKWRRLVVFRLAFFRGEGVGFEWLMCSQEKKQRGGEGPREARHSTAHTRSRPPREVTRRRLSWAWACVFMEACKRQDFLFIYFEN